MSIIQVTFDPTKWSAGGSEEGWTPGSDIPTGTFANFNSWEVTANSADGTYFGIGDGTDVGFPTPVTDYNTSHKSFMGFVYNPAVFAGSPNWVLVSFSDPLGTSTGFNHGDTGIPWDSTPHTFRIVQLCPHTGAVYVYVDNVLFTSGVEWTIGGITLSAESDGASTAATNFNGCSPAPRAKGYNAFTTVLDPDGMTAWAFEYFGAGFARFNISDGSIVHQDALLGVPGYANNMYSREDGTGMFIPSDDGFYYTMPTLTTDSYGVRLLHKSHVGAGPSGNLFNGYMIDDATLDVQPLFMDASYLAVEGWTQSIKPASDGNRYLALSNGYFSCGAVNVDTMAIAGKWDFNYNDAGNWPTIG